MKPYYYANEVLWRSKKLEKQSQNQQFQHNMMPESNNNGLYCEQNLTQEKIDEMYLDAIDQKISAIDCLTGEL